MAEHMIIGAGAAGIHKIQPSAANQPMLLGIICGHRLSVIPHPSLRCIEMQAIPTDGAKAIVIITQGEEIPSLEATQRWLI